MEWISIKNRSPTEKKKYLVVFDNQKKKVVTTLEYMPNEGRFLLNTKVTHWMEIPEPPSDLHECCYKGAEWNKCYQTDDTFWFMPMKGCFIAVKYCPLCGEKAPNCDTFEDDDPQDIEDFDDCPGDDSE